MQASQYIPQQFQQVKDSDEKIIWTGKPRFLPFLLTGVPFLIIGLIWGTIDLGFILQIGKDKASSGGPPMLFIVPFFLLHLFPFWGSILNIIRLFLVHQNTCYAITNKRLMMRSGFWGIDFKAIDYDKISDIEVTVNPIENMLGVGTIRAFSGRTTSKGANLYDCFIAIENPYEIFKRIKEISVDIKTDWNYPNAIRPETNPGYKTEYKKE